MVWPKFEWLKLSISPLRSSKLEGQNFVLTVCFEKDYVLYVLLNILILEYGTTEVLIILLKV